MNLIKPSYRNKRALCAVLLLALGLTACTSTTLSGTMGAERKQFIFLPESDYHQQSALAYNQMMGQFKQQHKIVSNAQVSRVTKRLIAQTPHYRADAANWQWQVNVVQNNEVNAFAMAGGKIAVYTGLLSKIKPSDDELAAVLGHEIAHALREHSREQASKSAAGSLLSSLITSYAGLGEAGNAAVGLAQQYGWNLPNSRQAENEADAIGLELMARAGYNPNAAVTLWQKMAAANGGSQGLAFLSTHPASADRISRLQAAIPRVMPYYQAAK